jgi:hypothetical protein
MSIPFADPAAPSSGISYAELQGSLLLVKVIYVEDHIPTVHTKPGEKNSAVRADVTVLDGPAAGQEYLDALIFPKVLQGQLKSRVGQYVLGRLGQGVAKPGQSAPWMLEPATDEDKRKAEAHLNGSAPRGQAANEEPPF